MDDFDTIPVRLPSGGKAIVQLPRKFKLADGVHLMNFLSEYVEENVERAPSNSSPAGAKEQDK